MMQGHPSKSKTPSDGEDPRANFPKTYKDEGLDQVKSSFSDHTAEDYRDEIDLFAVIEVFWERRLWIVGISLGCLIMSLVYLFTATPLYRISMEIRPGITGYQDGKAVYGWSVSDIVGWIQDGHYRPFLRTLLKKDKNIPEITAASGRNKNFITVWFEDADPQLGKKILQDVFQGWVHLYTKGGADLQIQQSYQDFDQQILSLEDQLQLIKQVKVKELEAKIATRQREMQTEEQKIALEKKQKEVNLGTIDELKKHQDMNLKNTNELIDLRNSLIKQRKSVGLSLLLYTNIIQQNIYNATNLRERIAQLQASNLKSDLDIDNYKKKIKDLNDKILNLKIQKEDVLLQKQRALQRQIDDLQGNKAILAPVEMVAAPIASERPVSPHTLRTIILAVIMGLFLGTMLVWFLEGWQTRQNHKG